MGTSTFRLYKTHCETKILAPQRLGYRQRLIGNPIIVLGLEAFRSLLLSGSCFLFGLFPFLVTDRMLHEETRPVRRLLAIRGETVALRAPVLVLPCIRPCRTFCFWRHALKESLLLHVSFALVNSFVPLLVCGLIPSTQCSFQRSQKIKTTTNTSC